MMKEIFGSVHRRNFAWFAAPLALLMVESCVSSSVIVTGVARAPTSPDQVRVYTSPPSSFEEVAQLHASRRSVGAGAERAIEKMIDEMKLAAARLGANGLLLEDLSDGQALSLGTGVGSETYTHHGSIGLGFGGDIGISKKTASGRAIFIASAPP